jgi:23S rRNA (guanosine2251-2'-O)-methyltransferase
VRSPPPPLTRIARNISFDASIHRLKTAMGAAEYVSLGDDGESISTLKTVLDLKAKGYKVIGVETTRNATMYWDTAVVQGDVNDCSIAYVFGNELIGVDVHVLRECDGIVCLPTYGMKNSLNVATCAGIVVWDRLRQLHQVRN